MDAKILCLAVLSRGDSSGYEIRKQFETGPFSHFQDAGFGSIYPALKKLTEDGLIAETGPAEDGRPDKKVYRITARGRQALFDAVNGEPGPDKFRSDFMFILFFADLLPPRRLDQLIAERVAFHEAEIGRMASADRAGMGPGEHFVCGMGQALHRAVKDYLESHRHELVGALLQRAVAE